MRHIGVNKTTKEKTVTDSPDFVMPAETDEMVWYQLDSSFDGYEWEEIKVNEDNTITPCTKTRNKRLDDERIRFAKGEMPSAEKFMMAFALNEDGDDSLLSEVLDEIREVIIKRGKIKK